MRGSLDEASDLGQETYLRAWRAYGEFEAWPSLRAWMYKIATKVCLRARQRRSRRTLPSGLGSASEDPQVEQMERADIMWLEPIPDAAVPPGPGDLRPRQPGQGAAWDDVAEPTEPENGDLAALEHALRKDAALEMVGYSTWFPGVETPAVPRERDGPTRQAQRGRRRGQEIRPGGSSRP